MELSQQAIHDVIHPTAAFSRDAAATAPADEATAPALAWGDSWLNPKNRIDSLDAVARPLWRIDGCTAFGSQLYAVPLFVAGVRPYRVDVFLPELATLAPALRRVLDVDAAFYTRDGPRIAQLGLTRHVLRILQRWAAAMDDPARLYAGLPFGSRIALLNLPVDVADARIAVVPAHHLERQLLSPGALRAFWAVDLPPAVDIDAVEYVEQLHDSVCLVRVGGALCIFKALTSYTKYLYHELRRLLALPPHANVIARPLNLVTKRCGFGAKVAVVGFTLEHHARGSLRDLIPFLQLHGRVAAADKARWALQLASALLHLRQTTATFYPDLRLDNIVLSDAGDAVMIDFEQRGVWCEFAAPEVNAIEYVRLLAVDDAVDAPVRAKYAVLLTRLLPGWRDMADGEAYAWPSRGYNVPWACLTPAEHEACEVYMLGRVLWCLFEARSAPQRSAVWLSYRWEPVVEFPGYTATPAPIRRLIDRCTRGRRPVLSSLVFRERGRLVLRELENTGRSTARDVQRTARRWWARELAAAEKWLEDRAAGMQRGDWNQNYYNRPSLRDVHGALEAFYAETAAAAAAAS